MAKRAREGWDLPHNKRTTKTSMKDLRHRRQRRGYRSIMRGLLIVLRRRPR